MQSERQCGSLCTARFFLCRSSRAVAKDQHPIFRFLLVRPPAAVAAAALAAGARADPSSIAKDLSNAMPKAPVNVRTLARKYTEDAIEALAAIMTDEATAVASRIAAANSLLDRGWGRVPQPVSGDDNNPLRVKLTQIVRTIVDPQNQDGADVSSAP